MDNNREAAAEDNILVEVEDNSLAVGSEAGDAEVGVRDEEVGVPDDAVVWVVDDFDQDRK